MARVRDIHPSLWISEQFASLSIPARLLYIGTFSHGEDVKGGDGFRVIPENEGVTGLFRASASVLRAQVFPHDTDITIEQVRSWRDEIASSGLIVLYQVDGTDYGYHPNWREYQHPNRVFGTTLPQPPKSRIKRVQRSAHAVRKQCVSTTHAVQTGTGSGSGSEAGSETGSEEEGCTPPDALDAPDAYESYTLTQLHKILPFPRGPKDDGPNLRMIRALEEKYRHMDQRGCAWDMLQYANDHTAWTKSRKDWRATFRNWVDRDAVKGTKNRKSPDGSFEDRAQYEADMEAIRKYGQ